MRQAATLSLTGASTRIRRALLVALLAGAGASAWPAAALAHGADLFIQAAKLTAGGVAAIRASSDQANTFGTSVAVSANGRVLAVGAPAVARIYVFVRPASGAWKNAHQTAALDGYTNTDDLGGSVAVSADGSTIVAGAPYENGQDGAVYVYVEPRGGWKNASVLPTMMLRADDSTGYDDLGASVAVSADGSTILTGAPGWNSMEGAIYLFTRAHGNWRHTSPLAGRWANVGEPGGNSVYGGAFGQTVAMSADGNTIAVGAPNESGWEGGVYVFERSHGAYRGYRELHDLASGTSDNYFICSPNSGYGIDNPELGSTVSISANGETIAAGQPCAGTGGQAVVFTEPRSGWLNASSNITAGLTPLRPYVFYIQQLGYWVALSGDGKTVIAADPQFTNGYGAYVAWFRKPRHGWSHVNPPVAANFGPVFGQTAFAGGAEDTTAGDPIAIGSVGGTIFVGGVGWRNEGAVYVFNETTPGPTPTSLSCTPSKVGVGSPSTCTATVSNPQAGGSTPHGSVTFSSNGGSSGHFGPRSCKLKGLKAAYGKVAPARCSVKFTPSSPLAYTITARYGGDVHHLAGSDTAVVRTARAPTSTSVACAPASVRVGVNSLCAATATGIGSPPTTITFKATGGTISGERCTPSTGMEVCSADFTAGVPGSFLVSAAYPGDAGHEPSSGHASVTVTTA